MNIDDLFKKRLLFFFASFLFIIVVTISSSYAILNNNDVDKCKVINNGNLKIIYPKGNDIIENCGYPLSYQQGNSVSPSNIIKIINDSSENTTFALYLKPENNVDNLLDVNKIYYSINDGDPILLSDKEDFLIFKSNIDIDEVYTLDIKVWASSELVNNEDQGKEINLIYDVIEILL